MNQLMISPKTLFCMARQLGAEEFFGVNDPFVGMKEKELFEAAGNAQKEMEKYGYAVIDERGEFQLEEKAKEWIMACTFPDVCLTAEYRSGEKVIRRNLYEKGDVQIAVEEIDGRLVLKRCDRKEAETFLKELLPVPEEKAQTQSKKAEFPVKTLKKAQLILGEDGDKNQLLKLAGDELRPYCQDETVSTILLEGLSGQAAVSAFARIAFSEDKAEGFLRISGKSGTVMVEPSVKDDWCQAVYTTPDEENTVSKKWFQTARGE